jgi:hypothetical protein
MVCHCVVPQAFACRKLKKLILPAAAAPQVLNLVIRARYPVKIGTTSRFVRLPSGNEVINGCIKLFGEAG